MARAVLLFVLGDKEAFVKSAVRARRLLEPLAEYFNAAGRKARFRAVEMWRVRVFGEEVSFRQAVYEGNELEGEVKYELAYRLSLARSKIEGRVRCANTVWVRRRSNLVAIFDAPSRGLARVLVEGMAYAFTGSAGVEPLRLSRADFESVEKWLAEREGHVIRAVFRGVPVEGDMMEEINVKRGELEATSFYRKLKGEAVRWRSLTFTMFLEGVGILTCRLADYGALTVYGRADLEAFDAALSTLEEVLGLRTVE